MKIRSNGKIYRTLEEWEEIIRRYELSGQSPLDFCEAESIAATTLYKWRKRLRGTRSEMTRGDFVEAKGLSLPRSDSSYEITLKGGRGIRVSAPFSASVLGELIRVVEQC